MSVLTILTFLLLGLGNGAVFSALGVSLAISYRSSNVVNFGAGSMALLGGVTYQGLRTQQAIFNPLAASVPITAAVLVIVGASVLIRWLRHGKPSITTILTTVVAMAAFGVLARQPTLIDIGGDLGTAVALAVTFALCSVSGLLLYWLVFRHLRTALPLTQAVASIGLLVLVPSLVTIRLGDAANTISAPSFLPDHAWRSGDLIIQSRQVWIAGIVMAVAVALTVLYKFTRFGLQTTAVAETEVGAVVLGISPNRVAGINWAICGAVAGMFGALIVSFAPVAPYDFALFVVAGLGAAMLGRMTSLGWATAGGLVIGMLESLAQYLASRYSFLPQQGLATFVPLVLLIGVMYLRNGETPTRGTLLRPSMPTAHPPRNVLFWTAGLTAATVVLALTLRGNYQVALATTLVSLLLTLSVVVLTGFAGQISLAQYMFAGVGAFLLSKLTVGWGIPFPLAPLIAVVAVTLFGALVSLPAVRLRGVNLAILTLAAGVTVQNFYFANAKYVGNGGSPTVERPTLFGLELGIGTENSYPRSAFALMMIVVVVPVCIGVVGLRRSSLGLQMLAVRTNERAAAANGMNVARIKLLAFSVSAFIAGLAGAFTGYLNFGGLSQASFDSFLSISLIASVFIAGISLVAGAVTAAVLTAGGMVTILFEQAVPSLSTWYPVVAGLALIVNAITMPNGIAGSLRQDLPLVVQRLRRIRAGDRAAAGEIGPDPAPAFRGSRGAVQRGGEADGVPSSSSGARS
ncbi:ABC transporter permease [Cryptosporangium sp. NPDC051539]|uniref:ABC transporter permease n=1 Tax=Cryptosporangium sp. NPDC051539 TaxID=3363962 RepID=UPI0037A3A9FA